MGTRDGTGTGTVEGTGIGTLDGGVVGSGTGTNVGTGTGTAEGTGIGTLDGDDVGSGTGTSDGVGTGTAEGTGVGSTVGSCEDVGFVVGWRSTIPSSTQNVSSHGAAWQLNLSAKENESVGSAASTATSKQPFSRQSQWSPTCPLPRVPTARSDSSAVDVTLNAASPHPSPSLLNRRMRYTCASSPQSGVGADVGSCDGAAVGVLVGAGVGTEVGRCDGTGVGVVVGKAVGLGTGKSEGGGVGS